MSRGSTSIIVLPVESRRGECDYSSFFSSSWERRIFLFCKTPCRREFFPFCNFYLYKGIQLRILHTVIKDKGSVFNYSNPKLYISSQISSVRSYSSLEFAFVKNTSLVLLDLTSSGKLRILNFDTWMSSKKIPAALR